MFGHRPLPTHLIRRDHLQLAVLYEVPAVIFGTIRKTHLTVLLSILNRISQTYHSKQSSCRQGMIMRTRGTPLPCCFTFKFYILLYTSLWIQFISNLYLTQMLSSLWQPTVCVSLPLLSFCFHHYRVLHNICSQRPVYLSDIGNRYLYLEHYKIILGFQRK